MKLFVRGLFACALALAAGMLFTGCQFAGRPARSFWTTHAAADCRRMIQPPRPPVRSPPPPNGADVARFHVGDNVIVSFSGDAGFDSGPRRESIKEDGTITLPLIGAVSAVGKTAGELQNEIHDDYVPKYYVRLTVTVKSGRPRLLRRRRSQERRAQSYTSDGTTVTKAIQSAGGLTDFANHGKVWLTHAYTGQRIQVNYDEALQESRPRTRRFIPTTRSTWNSGFSDDSAQRPFGKKGGQPGGCPPFSFPRRTRAGKPFAT